MELFNSYFFLYPKEWRGSRFGPIVSRIKMKTVVVLFFCLDHGSGYSISVQFSWLGTGDIFGKQD